MADTLRSCSYDPTGRWGHARTRGFVAGAVARVSVLCIEEQVSPVLLLMEHHFDHDVSVPRIRIVRIVPFCNVLVHAANLPAGFLRRRRVASGVGSIGPGAQTELCL